MSMLQVKNLKVHYGGIAAVKGVSFEVGRGEMVCLIGANGAGKTTTLKAIAGMIKPAGGSVHYAERDITGIASHTLVERGLALVPEGRGVFARLSVEENLAMGAYTRNEAREVKRDLEHAYSLFPRLKERRAQLAGTLSGGEQQMLAIGRALMSKPKLLVLDEPSMGLAPLMVQKIFETIRQVRDEGVTVLLVEQNAKLALEMSQRGYVMESGEVTLAGQAQALLDNPDVRKAYLGE